MQEEFESEKLAQRARKRILGLAEKDSLSTEDPLAVEVALAQVDATLAVAQAIMEVRDEIAIYRDGGNSKEAQRRRDLVGRIISERIDSLSDNLFNRQQQMAQSISELRNQVAMQNHQMGNAETSRERRDVAQSWWKFWRNL